MTQKHYVVLMFLGLMVGCTGKRDMESNQPVKVKVLEMQSSVIKGVQGFSGTVEETVGSLLSFSVGGTIQEMRVAPGQKVRKGELIARVDEATIRNSHDAAAATLAQAEDAYERMKQLHDNNSLPEIQWVEVQSRLKQARAAEQISRKSLEDCKLYAPFSGVIAEKQVEVGQNIMPGMPVVKLVTIDKVHVKIAVPENEIAKTALGQPAEIYVPALGGKAFRGTIVEKGIAAHPLSRSYEVKVSVENPSGELMPGMICQVHIEKESGRSALLLPASVIRLDSDNRSFVWVHQSGKAVKRFIRIGELTNGGVVIVSGLAAGDEVLIEGQQKVSEDMEIAIEK